MGRWATYPTTIDGLRRIEIGFLKKHGYLTPNQTRAGQITWTSQSGVKNTIGISVKMFVESGSLTLDYTYNGTDKINYNVQLVSRPSNLGSGSVWFFICPRTGKYCRNLYLFCGYFLHRSAFGLMYECQIEGKRMRVCNKLGKYWREEPFLQVYQKHFKRFYKGKPTKRYSRLIALNKEGERQTLIMDGILEGMRKKAGLE